MVNIQSEVVAVLLVGILISTSFWFRVSLQKIKLSPVAGYIIIGIILRSLEKVWNVHQGNIILENAVENDL